MFVIGLTGGIGTGKTRVSTILRDLGAEVIDADALGHGVYEPHTGGWREVVGAFGKEVLKPNGEVDRKKLGQIVFNDAEHLRRLNAIMHPRIYRLILERISRFTVDDGDVMVVEAALLLEAGWTALADEVWVVTALKEQVLQRLRARDNLDEAAVLARIQSQMPQSERKKQADAVIHNDGSLVRLRDQVEELWNVRVLPVRRA